MNPFIRIERNQGFPGGLSCGCVARIREIVIDALHPAANGPAPTLFFQETTDPKSEHRMHLDLAVDSRADPR